MNENPIQNNQNIEQKILEAIKCQKIKPRPKWHFRIREFILWSAFGMFTILSGLAAGAMFYLFSESDWHAYQKLNMNTMQSLISSIPIIWLLVIIVLGIAIYIDLKKTKNFYKRNTWLLLGLSVATIILLGAIGYLINLGEYTENIASKNIPYYGNLVTTKRDLWSQPEKGLLSGIISEISVGTSSEIIKIKDLRDKDWLIVSTNLDWKKLGEQDELNWHKIGNKIRILGKRMSSTSTKNQSFIFEAMEISNWK